MSSIRSADPAASPDQPTRTRAGTGSVRPMLVAGALGVVMAAIGTFVGLGVDQNPAIHVPNIPGLPTLPNLPTLPGGGFPTDLPGFPTDLPNLPNLPDLPTLPRPPG